MPQVTVPAGVSTYELTTPARKNGAVVTLTRQSWPLGSPAGEPLFRFRVYERERGGEFLLLCSGVDMGGTVTSGKTGETNPPLVTEIRWKADKDKDLIRVEIDATVSFTTNASISWL